METRCEFSELLPSGCGHCRGIVLADWEVKPKVTMYEGA